MEVSSEEKQIHRLIDGYVNRNKGFGGRGMCVMSTPPDDIFNELSSVTDGKGCTAIHIAAKDHEYIRLDYLIKTLEANHIYELMISRDKLGNTPLHYSAEYEGTDIFKYMLRLQSSDDIFHILKTQNEKGETAFHCAAKQGRDCATINLLKRVKNLGKKRKLLQIENVKGYTALFAALKKGHIKTSRHMLEAVTTKMDLLKIGELVRAISEKQEKVFQSLALLLNAKNFSTLMLKKSEMKESLVHFAMSEGFEQVVEIMLKAAKTCNKLMDLLEVLDNDGNTPIHHAARAGNKVALEKAMSFLNSEQKLKILDKRNHQGDTAIQTASIHRQAEAARALCEYITQ